MWNFHRSQISEVQPRISEVEYQIIEASIKYLVLTEMVLGGWNFASLVNLIYSQL